MIKKLIPIIQRTLLLLLILYIPHFVKNTVVSLLSLESIINMPNYLRVFNKIVALKVLTLLLIVFLLYNREYLINFKFQKIRIKNLLLYTFLAYLVMLWYYGSQVLINYYQLYQGIIPIIIVISQFLVLALYLVFACIAVFTKETLLQLHKDTKPQIYYFIVTFIIFTTLLALFEKAWFLFSGLVSIILVFLLDPFYQVQFWIEDAPILQINDFTVSIGAPCSGIDSMFLFFAFFAGIFALDHKRIKKRLYLLLFIIGFIGVYVVNILRLFLLMLIGIHISPEFAVGLFHTNAGWLFFVLYFLVYYWIIKRFIYKNNKN